MTESWGLVIEIKGADPSSMLELHKATGEALAHTVDNQGRENVNLRKRVVELKASFSPKPLFPQPLSIVEPDDFPLRF